MQTDTFNEIKVDSDIVDDLILELDNSASDLTLDKNHLEVYANIGKTTTLERMQDLFIKSRKMAASFSETVSEDTVKVLTDSVGKFEEADKIDADSLTYL